MFILYDIFYIFATILYLPYLCFRGKLHKGFWVRLGRIPQDIQKTIGEKENIWIHAVSVGEVFAVKGLVDSLKKAYPNYQIILSTVTKTGYHMAKDKIKVGDVVIFAPLDLSFVLRRMIALINPKIYIIAETELWPNILSRLHKRGVPIIQINGRISDKSLDGYKKIRFLLRGVLKKVSVFCMQSPLDQDRIISLGAPSENVKRVGNIKFDDLPQEDSAWPCFKIEKDKILWVAGSTHPGEEEIVLDAFRELLNDFTNLRLVIAPRHVERTDEISKIVAQKGFDPIRFSTIKHKEFRQGHVIVADTMGDLKSLYGMAQIVFVGKSLTVGGGHNIIEPAFFAKPIIIGPLMENFRDITELFVKDGAVIQIKHSAELAAQIRILLSDSLKRQRLGRLAKTVVEKNTGATQRTLAIISGMLKKV